MFSSDFFGFCKYEHFNLLNEIASQKKVHKYSSVCFKILPNDYTVFTTILQLPLIIFYINIYIKTVHIYKYAFKICIFFILSITIFNTSQTWWIWMKPLYASQIFLTPTKPRIFTIAASDLQQS